MAKLRKGQAEVNVVSATFDGLWETASEQFEPFFAPHQFDMRMHTASANQISNEGKVVMWEADFTAWNTDEE